MRRLIVCLLLGCTMAGAPRAQTNINDEDDAEKLVYMVQWVGTIAGISHVSSYVCQTGSPDPWQHIVEKIDRHIARCVPPGSALGRALDREFPRDRANYWPGRGPTSIAFERKVSGLSQVIPEVRAGCSEPRARNWLEQGPDSDPEFK